MLSFDSHSSVFPIQKLSISKKGKSWRRGCVDAIIGREGGGFISGQPIKETMRIDYDLYNSIFNEKDLHYVTDPFKVEDGFPAAPQNFNIIRPKIDLLVGEESKRPFNMVVYQTNEEAVSFLEEKAKQMLFDHVIERLGAELEGGKFEGDVDEILAEIQDTIKNKYNNPAERTAHLTLQHLTAALNLDNEFLKGWKDGLIGGQEVYFVGIVNGEPVLERVNPLHFSCDRDPDLEFTEDGDWALRKMIMTPTAIYDRFYGMLTEKDLDNILKLAYGDSSKDFVGSDFNRIVYRNMPPSGVSNEADLKGTYLNVWHATWKSFKKIGFVTQINENGEEDEVVVDENYVAAPGERVDWDWVVEVWEGYRIGKDIYVGINPISYQTVSMDNPNSQKLPYTGVRYSDTNSKGRSLVNIMKPLQYMYIILWYRLELALARDKGKIITMDITQIPKSQGVDINKWLHYLTAVGVNFVNPYEEGWDIPGREGGKAASFNQIGQVDLTVTNVITQYIELMNKIEEMVGEISGVSKQRQGAIEQRELVGNVERAVVQSSHITEPLFWNHTQAKRKALILLLDTAKFAWRQSNKKKLYFILDDASRVFQDINESFFYSDFDVFVTDSTKENRNIEALKTLLQPAMQGGASLLDVANILTSNNMNEIKQKLDVIETKRLQAEQAAQKAEQEAAAEERAIQHELQTEELRIQEEDSVRRSTTDVEVALIKAEQGIIASDEEIDWQKMEMQRSKQTQDVELKRQQISETVRAARKAEQQRDEEIQIRRKQANKPVAKNK